MFPANQKLGLSLLWTLCLYFYLKQLYSLLLWLFYRLLMLSTYIFQIRLWFQTEAELMG